MSTSRLTKPKVEPYLSFDGRCEEALEFYRKALGAEILMLMRFSDSPEICDPSMMKPGFDKKVMHSLPHRGIHDRGHGGLRQHQALIFQPPPCPPKPSRQVVTRWPRAEGPDAIEQISFRRVSPRSDRLQS
jgi:hypothetical protein